ncbi:MAG: response regulator transcription factor [Nitrospinae bacterium]|nr:response regulator transcription factor [Nitrospinota bacterium]MDA1109888.1 response regulator transcription factor [Nitrospinota bacterium]
MAEKTETIHILIADDHPVFRQGLHRAFAESCGLQVVAEAVNGSDLLEKVRAAKKVDIVLLDITMDGEWSLDYMKELKGEFPDLPVIVLSVYPEEHFAMRYIKAGASGYVTKESPLEILEQAVRKVAAGGRFLSPEFMEKMAFNFSSSVKQPHESLSNREFQVYRLLVSGVSLTAIAEKLFLSVKTVSTHRSRILQKMKMETNAELIQYAIFNKLI